MAQFDLEKLKKYQRGERVGTVALFFCAAVFFAFAALLIVARARESAVLNVVAWAAAPPLLVAGAAVAAYCNLKFGCGITAMIKKYVTETLIENAHALRPEKTSLSFEIGADETSVQISVNGGKERIVFDFSPFGKFTLSRRAAAMSAVADKLNSTFIKLYERGSAYSSVEYRIINGKKKAGKPVPVIVDGKPDLRAFKACLKSK